MKTENDLDKIREIDGSLSEQLMNSLVSENFKSSLNYSNILALSAFFALKAHKLNDIGSLAVLVTNEQIAKYLLSPSGFVNSLQFIESKKVSLQDAQNQMLIIECLIKFHFDVAPLTAPRFACLLNTLCENLLNLNSIFREAAVLTCFENLQYLESKFTIPLFKIMFEKISEVSSRPAPQLAENEFRHEQSLMIGKKIQYVIKMLYNATDGANHKRNSMLEKQEFFLLLRTICHPYVSAKSKDLMAIMRTLTDIMDKQAELNGHDREFTLPSYFQKHIHEIIQYALV